MKRRETARPRRAFALQHPRVKVAQPGILQYTVANPIEGIAGFIDRMPDQRRSVGGDRSARVGKQGRHHPQVRTDLVMRLVIVRVTGNDPIVVGGEALRFHQGFLAALRTAGKIRVRRRAPEIAGDNFLAYDRRQVSRTVTVVDHLFRVPQGEATGWTGVIVTRVGCGGCVTTHQCRDHGALVDRPA